MKTVTYKKLMFFQNYNDSVSRLGLNADDYAVIGRMSKLIKKLNPKFEEFQEMVEDLRLDHCMKDGLKIVRENNQLQWTAEGEKSFRKAYKQLLETEVEVEDFTPLSYNEILSLLPNNVNGRWEEVEEILSPFFEYTAPSE
jgi:hypothetical protein